MSRTPLYADAGGNYQHSAERMQNLNFPIFEGFWRKQLLRLQAQTARTGPPIALLTITMNEALLKEWIATFPPCGNGALPGTFPWLSE
jgi:hypothetical protein